MYTYRKCSCRLVSCGPDATKFVQCWSHPSLNLHFQPCNIKQNINTEIYSKSKICHSKYMYIVGLYSESTALWDYIWPLSFLWCPVHFGDLSQDNLGQFVFVFLCPVLEDGHSKEVCLLVISTQDGPNQVRGGSAIKQTLIQLMATNSTREDSLCEGCTVNCTCI